MTIAEKFGAGQVASDELSSVNLGTVKIGKAFRVVLPPEFREQYGLQEGELLSVDRRGAALVLTPLREKQQAIQAKYAGRFPGLIDELIAERRAEAEKE